jgi:hypothetical protein
VFEQGHVVLSPASGLKWSEYHEWKAWRVVSWMAAEK